MSLVAANGPTGPELAAVIRSDAAGSTPATIDREAIAAHAARVLADNDRGDHTVAAPALYPHQWSWDSAFIAIGWSTLSVPRALIELDSLLRGQWSTGMIPHIVFSAEPGYFPGPSRWCSTVAEAAPRTVQTSGICQPPVHGLAVHLIREQAVRQGGRALAAYREFAERTIDQWFAWHRWIERARRDPESGLIAIHHGWESGMDNSPRWDGPYSRVATDRVEPYVREDLNHVDNPTERPGDRDYDRYIWLVDQLRSVRYDDDAAARTAPFRAGDVLFTALHGLGADLLAEIADELDRPEPARELRSMAVAARAAVLATVDPASGLARDRDLRTGQWLATETIAGFAPLICGVDDARLQADQVALLLGERWCGHPALHTPLPPTTSPESPAFVPQAYWRGPQWPVTSWLLSWALRHRGYHREGAALTRAGIGQLADLRFAEYYHPLDGQALGSDRQSWTAAAGLAWLAESTEPADPAQPVESAQRVESAQPVESDGPTGVSR